MGWRAVGVGPGLAGWDLNLWISVLSYPACSEHWGPITVQLAGVIQETACLGTTQSIACLPWCSGVGIFASVAKSSWRRTFPRASAAQLVSEDAALWPLTQHNPEVLTGLQWGEGKEPPLWIRGGLGREVEKLRLELWTWSLNLNGKTQHQRQLAYGSQSGASKASSLRVGGWIFPRRKGTCRTFCSVTISESLGRGCGWVSGPCFWGRLYWPKDHPGGWLVNGRWSSIRLDLLGNLRNDCFHLFVLLALCSELSTAARFTGRSWQPEHCTPQQTAPPAVEREALCHSKIAWVQIPSPLATCRGTFS